jgi:hypothetical protein
MALPAPGPNDPQNAPAPPLWRRLLPWIVAILLLGFLASRTDRKAIAGALASVNALVYLGFVAAFVGLSLVCDTFATWRTYRRVAPSLPFRALLVVRGASYLPSLLNYHVGQAYVTYLLARAHRTPMARVVGGTLLVYATLLSDLILTALAGVPFVPSHAPWAAGLVVPLALGVVGYWGILALKPRVFTRFEALAPLFEAGVGGHLRLMLWRLPHVTVLWAGYWANYWLFGIRPPLTAALTSVPILLLVTAVPITPQGVGTRELVAIELLAPYAPGTDPTAPVLAAGVAWVAISTLCFAATGIFCARGAARLLSFGTGGTGGGSHEAGAGGDVTSSERTPET